jgi:hypothetical protein
MKGRSSKEQIAWRDAAPTGSSRMPEIEGREVPIRRLEGFVRGEELAMITRADDGVQWQGFRARSLAPF